MISKELKEKYFVEEITEISNDMTGWRVLGMITEKQGLEFELKTTLDGWLEEFRIRYTPISGSGIILVDQDCPDLYFLDSDDIKDLVKECIEECQPNLLTTDWNKFLTDEGNGYVKAVPYTGIWTTSTSPNWIYDGSSTITTIDNSVLTDVTSTVATTAYTQYLADACVSASSSANNAITIASATC